MTEKLWTAGKADAHDSDKAAQKYLGEKMPMGVEQPTEQVEQELHEDDAEHLEDYEEDENDDEYEYGDDDDEEGQEDALAVLQRTLDDTRRARDHYRIPPAEAPETASTGAEHPST